MDRQTTLNKIISMRQDIQDVQYGLIELKEMYKELGITLNNKEEDLLKTAMNYLASAESVLSEMEQIEEACQ